MTMPPGPHGSDPDAQGQVPPPGQQPPYPPQGQFPPGQQPPYQQPGQQPPYPPQGQFPPGQQPPYQQPGQQSAGNAKKWLIPAIGAVVLIVVVVVLGVLFLGSSTPEVGDCLSDTSGEDVRIVDCDSDEAEAEVIGIQEGEQTQREYLDDTETCAAFPETENALWLGDTEDTDSKGTVYCLTGR